MPVTIYMPKVRKGYYWRLVHYTGISDAFFEASKINQTDQWSNETKQFTFSFRNGEKLFCSSSDYFRVKKPSLISLYSYIYKSCSWLFGFKMRNTFEQCFHTGPVLKHFGGDVNLTSETNKGALQLITSSRKVILAILKIMVTREHAKSLSMNTVWNKTFCITSFFKMIQSPLKSIGRSILILGGFESCLKLLFHYTSI